MERYFTPSSCLNIKAEPLVHQFKHILKMTYIEIQIPEFFRKQNLLSRTQFTQMIHPETKMRHLSHGSFMRLDLCNSEKLSFPVKQYLIELCKLKYQFVFSAVK